MRRHTKFIVGGLVGAVLLVGGGSFVYVQFIHDSDPAFTAADVSDRLGDAADDGGDGDGGIGSALSAEGTWTTTAESVAGYRVKENVNGFDVDATGRTNDVVGTLTIAGTVLTEATFTVDLTTVKSDDARRDSQFRGRIMNTAEFPSATFALTTPIDFGGGTAGSSNLQDGISVELHATGDLTLHGVTRSVTFTLSASVKNGRIGVLGWIPVTFADYGIDNPSFATVTTEDHGSIEFILVLAHD